ncbi:MAG: hypothetical protein J5746_12165 [Victivallales bacterium]|nr:hypothetical protein [Victivallales bacterium]
MGTIDRFKNWLKEKLALQSEIVCINWNCKHRRADSFACNLKQVVIDKNGICSDYEEAANGRRDEH